MYSEVEPTSPSGSTADTLNEIQPSPSITVPVQGSLVTRVAAAAGDLPFYVIAAVVGAGSSMQAGVNLSLARVLTGGNGHNTLAAAFVSFLGGVTALVIINGAMALAAKFKGRPLDVGRPKNWWELLGGVFGSVVMICTLVATPHIGFALLSVMRIGGNLLTATVFDHIGFLGITKRTMSSVKGVGLMVLLGGAMLSVWDDLDEHSSAPFSWTQAVATVGCAILAVFAGILLPVQVSNHYAIETWDIPNSYMASVNRVLSSHLNGRLRATLVSFSGGTICLLAESSCWTFLIEPQLGADLTVEHSEWWMYTGGLFGVLTVSMNIYLPSKIGLTANFIFQIVGGISFSVVLDLIGAFGLAERAVSLSRILGLLLTAGGALVVMNSKRHIQAPETSQVENVEMKKTESVALTVSIGIASLTVGPHDKGYV